MNKLYYIEFLLLLISSNFTFAELVNVEVGGKLEIYGGVYHNWIEPLEVERIPQSSLLWRSIGPDGTCTPYRTGKGAGDCSFIEQRTRLNIKANFSENICFFVEFDDYCSWGDDFRSKDYISGLDSRSQTDDDIEVFQSYFEIGDFFNFSGLTLTVGRQAIDFGSGWLVGSDPGPDPFAGLSLDGIRIKYEQDLFTLNFFYTKLFEDFKSFNQNDIDFGGAYLTLNNIVEGGCIDLYWFILRDDRDIESTESSPLIELFEDLFDRDQVVTTYIHTIGLRVYGEYSDLDYDFEIAYQWEQGSHPGLIYIPVGGLYGDDDVQWDLPAGHFEIGYTFYELIMQPRLYMGGCYYGGKDKRDISFSEWLLNIGEGEASTSFNRLFSSYREDNFIDSSAMSNFWKVYTGTTLNVNESLELGMEIMYLRTVSPFHSPFIYKIADRDIYIFGPLSFITKENNREIGWQTLVYVNYSLTEDLNIEFGWAHFFVGSGLSEGSFIDNNGTKFISTLNTDDADLVIEF